MTLRSFPARHWQPETRLRQARGSESLSHWCRVQPVRREKLTLRVRQVRREAEPPADRPVRQEHLVVVEQGRPVGREQRAAGRPPEAD